MKKLIVEVMNTENTGVTVFSNISEPLMFKAQCSKQALTVYVCTNTVFVVSSLIYTHTNAALIF